MKPLITIPVLMAIVGFAGVIPAPAPSASTSSIVRCDGESMHLNTGGAAVATILYEIQKECGIDFAGIPIEVDHPVSVSQSANRQDVLQNFLQVLGVNSYALEYRDDLLIQVTILPVSAIPDADRPDIPTSTPESPEKPFADGLRIIDVIEGSQADLANLQEGDLILYYDGQRVTQPADLVQLSQARGAQEPVELVVIRDGAPIRIYLNGGFIGIRIRTGLIDRSVLEKYMDIMR